MPYRRYYYSAYQSGGGNCSLCGSPGATKATCPLNSKAKNPDASRHPLARTGFTKVKTPSPPTSPKIARLPKPKSAPKLPAKESTNGRKKASLTPKTGKYALPPPRAPTRLWAKHPRDYIIDLANRVEAGEEEAIDEALDLNNAYCSHKSHINDIYYTWKETGEITDDYELEIAADFLGRWCRCIQELKEKNPHKPSGLWFGSCQKSIYNTRGFKALATRGADKIWECDDDLAIAQNRLKNLGYKVNVPMSNKYPKGYRIARSCPKFDPERLW